MCIPNEMRIRYFLPRCRHRHRRRRRRASEWDRRPSEFMWCDAYENKSISISHIKIKSGSKWTKNISYKRDTMINNNANVWSVQIVYFTCWRKENIFIVRSTLSALRALRWVRVWVKNAAAVRRRTAEYLNRAHTWSHCDTNASVAAAAQISSIISPTCTRWQSVSDESQTNARYINAILHRMDAVLSLFDYIESYRWDKRKKTKRIEHILVKYLGKCFRFEQYRIQIYTFPFAPYSWQFISFQWVLVCALSNLPKWNSFSCAYVIV